MAPFKLVGGLVPKGGAQVPGVVPALDEVEDGEAGLASGLERPAVDDFAFESGKEARAGCVGQCCRIHPM